MYTGETRHLYLDIPSGKYLKKQKSPVEIDSTPPPTKSFIATEALESNSSNNNKNNDKIKCIADYHS